MGLLYNSVVKIAYDTCTGYVNAFFEGEEFITSEKKGGNRTLFLGINDLLKARGEEFSSISQIAFTIGPGSFTGIRIGIAAALGFHYGRKAVLHPVCTLQAYAWASGRRGDVHVEMPAHRGHHYYAHYRVMEKETEVIKPPRLVYRLPEVEFAPPQVSLSRAIWEHFSEIPQSLPPIEPVYLLESDAKRS